MNDTTFGLLMAALLLCVALCPVVGLTIQFKKSKSAEQIVNELFDERGCLK